MGGGGHCKSVIDAAESAGWEIGAVLDVPSKTGTRCLDHEICGTDADIPRYTDNCEFLVTVGQVGNADTRRRLQAQISSSGGSLAVVVASTARVSPYARIGAGTVVLHQACINADAIVGEGCIINTLADIEHDVSIGDFCHISTGAVINGGCHIGAGCFIGSRAMIAQCVTVAPDTIIGAGAVVIHDITVPGTYVGVPARKI